MAFIENGIKFACEPCIRGHRSSKCQHADRNLVEVRKPGRPLSSCPHTGDCSCPKGVRVAIPKSSKCSCGNKPSTNGVTKSYSTSSTTNGTGLVKGRNRLNSRASEHLEELLVISEDAGIRRMKTDASNADLNESKPNGTDTLHHAAFTKEHVSPPRTIRPDEVARKTSSPVQHQQRSCCAGKKQGSPLANSPKTHINNTGQSPTMHPEHINGIVDPESVNGLASRKSASPPTAQNHTNGVVSYDLDGISLVPTSSFNNIPMPRTTQSYIFPGELSTWDNPLTLETVSQIQQRNNRQTCELHNDSAPNFSNQMGPLNKDGYHHTPHGCQCGDNCSCLLCPAHPFNKASAAALHQMSQEMSVRSPTRAFSHSFINSASINGPMHATEPPLGVLGGNQAFNNPSQHLYNEMANGSPATWTQEPLIPLSPPTDQPFSAAEYYHLWYPSSWIESNAKQSPPQ